MDFEMKRSIKDLEEGVMFDKTTTETARVPKLSIKLSTPPCSSWNKTQSTRKRTSSCCPSSTKSQILFDSPETQTNDGLNFIQKYELRSPSHNRSLSAENSPVKSTTSTYHYIPVKIFLDESYISLLPNECIMYILGFLDVSQLCRCSRVSKRWHSLSMENQLWRDAFFLEFGTIPSSPLSAREEFKFCIQEISTDVENVSTYAKDIYDYYFEKEKSLDCNDYFEYIQTDIRARYRIILINWLAEVCLHLRLLSETYFLTVQIIDRYCHKEVIAKDQYQLLGVSALLVAGKIEEPIAPLIGDLAYISMVTVPDIKMMELRILNALDMNFNYATPLLFLRRFSMGAHSTITIHVLCKYLIELSTLSCYMLSFKPSTIAAAAVYIARKTLLNVQAWTPTLEYYTRMTESDIRECVICLNDLFCVIQSDGKIEQLKDDMDRPWLIDIVRLTTDKKLRFDFIPKKYRLSRYKRVALIPSKPTHTII
eukprot:TRINITY_DN12024_c0_g1_i1.p1 TRINITY_DN12024_c0_g1~~TRINITY_DN12024_c0_g1_i1.p1  ORF type:complete len:482 (-),score=57.28 TRINITY_DN12024_c0_g1_i1:207-1652(-)